MGLPAILLAGVYPGAL